MKKITLEVRDDYKITNCGPCTVMIAGAANEMPGAEIRIWGVMKVCKEVKMRKRKK